MSPPKRILLGHLASLGDCLYATVIARQIKQDFPGCHLTWAVGSMYRAAVDENPYVDEIWEIPLTRRSEMDAIWRQFAVEAKRRYRNGQFDEVFLTQLGPDNYQNFDGTIRSSTFRGYPRPIRVSVTPVIRLKPDEIDKAQSFADLHQLKRYPRVVLFESASASSQSFITPDFAAAVARLVVAGVEDCVIILSSNLPIDTGHARILDGSVLSFRENAELSKYCTLLVGCSSGISWLSTSDWSKHLPTIQVLSKRTSVFASMLHDAEYFGLPTDEILEMTDCSREKLADCICMVMRDGFPRARSTFHERIPVELNFYIEVFMRAVLRQGQPLKIVRSLGHVLHRYGPGPFWRYALSKTRFHR